MTPGTLIAEKYRLRRILGEGAMGVVWAAVNEMTEREVALKLLNRQNPDLRARLLREARACGRLAHRNVIEILDVGETREGDPFLVMPLLSGETLADRLRREGLLSQALAARIGSDIARGLSAAHAAGIVHRDLKPANVFLHREAGSEEAFVVKVLDFGVSKLLDAGDIGGTVPGGAVGSPLYMSPEQAKGDRLIDARADVWAVGVVLFEMLTGTLPFHGETMFTVVAQILADPIPSVLDRAPHVDRALAAVVARCLERNRDQRVGSATELATLLHRFAGAREGVTPTAAAIQTLLLRKVEVPPDDEAATAFFKKPACSDAAAAELLGPASVGPLDGTMPLASLPAYVEAAPVPVPAPLPLPTPEPSLISSTTPLVQPADPAPETVRGAAPPAARPRRAGRWLALALAGACVLTGGGALYRRLARPPSPPAAAIAPPPPPAPPEPEPTATATAAPSSAPAAAASATSAAPAPSHSAVAVDRRKPAAPPAPSAKGGGIIRGMPF